jgi:hypothetical protein
MDNTQVHDVTITQTSRFTLQGKVLPAILVRYYVGDHGPFTDQYDEGPDNAQQIKDGYARRIATLTAAGATGITPGY